MGYLSTALARLASKNGMKQVDIVRESGLDKSIISRLFNAEKLTIGDEDFIRVLAAFKRQPEDQAELIAARCMDVRVGPAADLVDIRVKRSAPAGHGEENFGFPYVELSHEGERAFAWLRSQCPLNPDLERHLIGFAKLTGLK
jgi:hypothetical protein